MLHSVCKILLRCGRNGYITVTPHSPSMAVSLSLLRYLSSDGDNTHSFTVNYLINSCGLSPKSALSASKSVSFESSEKPDSVLSTFEKLGFSKTQISEMVKKFPHILNCNVEKTISPKVEFFRSKGASTPKLVKIFTINPMIVSRSLKNQLVPTFNILYELLRSEFKAIEVVKRNPWVLHINLEACLKPNISTLKENGVPTLNIFRLIYKHWLCIGKNPVEFRKIVEDVKEFGFNPLKVGFVLAVEILTSVTKSKWDRRVEVYRRWGWSDEDVTKAFKKYPSCMAYSEDKITAAMDFCVNQLGLDSSVMVNYPVLLGYSLKRRLIPRGVVIQVLSTKGLVKLDSSITCLFKCTEKRFLEKYANDPHLEKLYKEKLDLSVDEMKIGNEMKMQ